MNANRWLTVAMGTLLVLSSAAEEAIDWARAKQLHQKQQQGQPLTDDEEAYLQRAIAEHNKGHGPDNGPRPNAPAPKPSIGVKPLTELGRDDKYKGEDGGLYGAGRNEPAAALAAAAKRETAKIQPLDKDGKPSKDGKIGLISVGMSNTTQEFSQFLALANRDPDKSPHVFIVDGAQGGRDAADWADTEQPWQVLDQRLGQANVSAAQVQVAWLKQALKGPARLGDFPAHAKKLQTDNAAIVASLKKRFPNLRLVYLSSRIYAGYANTALNPEPFAYESAFAVRWLIRDQKVGEQPVLLWGPYLWDDGTTPRKSDGLVWTREDLGGDGTHPSDSGRRKVAEMLLKFFKTDSLAKTWFTTSAR